MSVEEIRCYVNDFVYQRPFTRKQSFKNYEEVNALLSKDNQDDTLKEGRKYFLTDASLRDDIGMMLNEDVRGKYQPALKILKQCQSVEWFREEYYGAQWKTSLALFSQLVW